VAGSDSVSDYEIALLAIPLVATFLIWFWISNMLLIQNPASTLSLVGISTILATAFIAAMEAHKAGITSGKGSSVHQPVLWFFCMLGIWIVTYPAFLHNRRLYGMKDRMAVGIVVTLIFSFSWYSMSTAIDTTKDNARQKIEQIQQQFQQQLQEQQQKLQQQLLLLNPTGH